MPGPVDVGPGRRPARHRIGHPDSFQGVPIGRGGGAGRLGGLPRCGGVADRLERRRGRGRCGVGGQPAAQACRVSHLQACLGEIAVDDAVQVRVQQRPSGRVRPAEDGGQTAADDLLDVLLEPHSRRPADGWPAAGEQRGQRHRRDDSPLGEGGGPHAQVHDASCTGVRGRGLRGRRPGEEEPSWRGVLVHGPAHDVPCSPLWCHALPGVGIE